MVKCCFVHKLIFHKDALDFLKKKEGGDAQEIIKAESLLTVMRNEWHANPELFT